MVKNNGVRRCRASSRYDGDSGAAQEAFRGGGLGAASGCFSSRSLHYDPLNMKRRQPKAVLLREVRKRIRET
jgi:hypothetical protein